MINFASLLMAVALLPYATVLYRNEGVTTRHPDVRIETAFRGKDAVQQSNRKPLNREPAISEPPARWESHESEAWQPPSNPTEIEEEQPSTATTEIEEGHPSTTITTGSDEEQSSTMVNEEEQPSTTTTTEVAELYKAPFSEEEELPYFIGSRRDGEREFKPDALSKEILEMVINPMKPEITKGSPEWSDVSTARTLTKQLKGGLRTLTQLEWLFAYYGIVNNALLCSTEADEVAGLAAST
eukprot:GHVS01017888.1.p1 GENE.GHVS01017888.1~~GHVS01017888.1.p1  ORF type:complete len:241 (+),score=45.62 GHVS01017888.1:120-842(+)